MAYIIDLVYTQRFMGRSSQADFFRDGKKRATRLNLKGVSASMTQLPLATCLISSKRQISKWNGIHSVLQSIHFEFNFRIQTKSLI